MGRSNNQMKSTITDTATRMAFGKYRGESVGDILEVDPGYLLWLHKNTYFELGSELLEAAERENADLVRTLDKYEWTHTQND